VQHIYGNASVLRVSDRPNLFVKELKMYIDYLINEIKEGTSEVTAAQIKKLQSFKNNLIEGIAYYETLFSSINFFESSVNEIQKQLNSYKAKLIDIKIPELTVA